MKIPLFPRLFVTVLLILMTAELYAQSDEGLVEVQRIKKIQGVLHYQLFACPSSPDVLWDSLIPIVTGQVAIEKNSLFLSFPNLESGHYVVRVFQDLNDNKQLDFSSKGIPQEPTGFSNNPSLLLGYPNPIDSCFSYGEGKRELVVIKLNNKKQRKRRKIR